MLVATGRKPFTDGLGAWMRLASKMTDRGQIAVNDQWETSMCKGVYAIGDVIEGPMLAHKAEDEGMGRRRHRSRANMAMSTMV